MEILHTITTTEYSLDWYTTKKVDILKNYWHKFILTLRYGGGSEGSCSWYLTCERYEGDETIRESYSIMYIRDAVECYNKLPIHKIETYDNIKGLHNFIKAAANTEKIITH